MTDTTPYRTAPNNEAYDSPPWWARHAGSLFVVATIVVVGAAMWSCVRSAEEGERVARVAKHGATLAKIHRMTWPEMLRVTP